MSAPIDRSAAMAVGPLTPGSDPFAPVIGGFWDVRDRWTAAWVVAQDTIGENTGERSYQSALKRWASHEGSFLVVDRSNKADPNAVGLLAASGAAGSGYKYVAQQSADVCLAGVADWLAKVDVEYRKAVATRLDARVGGVAYRVMRAWPVFSGLSRSKLDVEIGTLGSDLIYRLRSRAPYTLIAKSTREAWGKARKEWATIPGLVADDLARLKIQVPHG